LYHKIGRKIRVLIVTLLFVMMSVTFIGDSSYNTGKSGNMTTFLGVSPDGKGWLDDVNGQLVLHLSGTG